MNKLKYIRVQEQDSSYSNDIPIGVDAQNVDMKNGNTLQDTIGNLNVTIDDNITEQLSQLHQDINQLDTNKLNKSDVNNYVPPVVTNWLNNNVTPAGSTVTIDKSLSIEESAADAKATGDKIQQTRDDIDNLKTDLKEYGWSQNVFTVNANKTHSSTKDKIEITIHTGEVFYVGLFSKTKVTDRAFALHGFNNSIDTLLERSNLNSFSKITSDNDYTSIGMYVSSGLDDITLSLIILKENTIIYTLYDEIKTKPSIAEIDNHYRVFDVFQICKFTVAANKTHSGVADQIDVDLKNGEQIYVYAIGDGGRTHGTCTISNGSTNVQIGSAYVNQISGPFTVSFDANKLSFYTPTASIDETMIFVVIKSSSILTYLYQKITDLYQITTENIEFVRKLKAAMRKASTVKYSDVTTPVPFMIAHFSDIHGKINTMKAIQKFKTDYANYLDDIICTGDMVNDHYSEGMDFWNNNSDGSILMCIGNHDSLGDNGWSNPVEQSLMYQRYIEPYVGLWNANTVLNHSYWYKDYIDKKIRLIALDTTIFDSTEQDEQITWYTNILSDALTNGYTVVGAQHFPPIPNNFTKINSNFTAIKHGTATDMSKYAWYTYNSRVLSVTQTFIDNGGNFACWLCGHTHGDLVSYDSRYPNQLFITITCAMPSDTFDETPRAEGKDMYAINVVAIDSAQKYIKIIRKGPEWDYALRHKGYCVFNYAESPAVVVNYG